GADMGAKRIADLVGIHVADEAERDLGAGLGRDHGLEALAGVAADHAIDLASWARPGLLENRARLLAGGDRQTDVAEEGFVVETERLPTGHGRGVDFPDVVIEARDGH